MEKCVITKEAVADLVRWAAQERNSQGKKTGQPEVKLPTTKKPLRVSFTGWHQVDVDMEILVKSGANILKTTEKFHQKLSTILKELAGLELRRCKITVRGLYDDEIEEPNP